MDNNELGITISEKRKALKLTQQELADAVGVTNKAVSKWELGYSLPDITNFKSIAKALECDVLDLLSAGQVIDSDKLEEKEVVSIMEKSLEVLLSFNVKKIVSVVYALILGGCLLAIGVTLIVDLVINKAITFSMITSTALLSAIAIFTVIKINYQNIEKCIMLSFITAIVSAFFIVLSVSVYLDLVPQILSIAIPVIITSLILGLCLWFFFRKSSLHLWVKIHLSVVVIEIVNTLLVYLITDKTWELFINIGIIVLMMITLPLTINKSKTYKR